MTRRLILMILVSSFTGWIAWLSVSIIPHRKPSIVLYEDDPDQPRFPPIDQPAAHLVPATPGGTALRFAMVHDVIHERYLKHGAAYFQARDARSQAVLDRENARVTEGSVPSAAWLDALDDLGVGLERQGKSDQAIMAARRKLEILPRYAPEPQPTQVQAKAPTASPSPEALQWYRAHANLGTFLIHASFTAARQGDLDAQARLREGLGHIEKAIEINPGAHFGRENWQVVIARFLLDAIQRPELLTQQDFLGNRFDSQDFQSFPGSMLEGHMEQFLPDPDLIELAADPNAGAETRARMARTRQAIKKVGAEKDFDGKLVGPLRLPVPFDEPVLGILGMWTLGGGPNPHFAQALGEIMLRVGQHRIAWCAYERAAEMADRFWPDPEIQRLFTEHCRRRQELALAVEQSTRRGLASLRGMREPRKLDPDQLRAQFRSELAHGQKIQAKFQEFEQQWLSSHGPDADLSQISGAFLRANGPISSPVGRADVARSRPNPTLELINRLPSVMLGLAIGAGFCLAIFLLIDLGGRVFEAGRSREKPLGQVDDLV